MSFRIIWKKIATIATLGTNQDSTLEWDATKNTIRVCPELLREGTSSKIGIFDVVPISLAYKWHMSNGERDDKRI